jgi:hypothetical protein
MPTATVKRVTLLTLAAASLAACASPGVATPTGCDGHHRRPANANGSVLNGPVTPAAAQPPVTPKASSAPCGGAAA